jgi:hypothetical protein
MNTVQIFNARFNTIKNEIPFNPEWNNGTDYLDHSVNGPHAVKLAIGEMGRSTTPMPNNRRMIFVGTPLGTVVVFERYTGGKHDVFVTNITDELRESRLFITPGAITQASMHTILGYPDDFDKNENLGTMIARICELIKTTEGKLHHA